MSLDHISWLAALLVMSAVVVKMLSGHSISIQKRAISRLEKQRDQVREKLQEVCKQRVLVDENMEFYERRRTECEETIGELRDELEILEAAARKRLAVYWPADLAGRPSPRVCTSLVPTSASART